MAHQKRTKKKKTTPSSSSGSLNSSLALSSFHQQLEALEAEHQWFLKQIKRKRSELKNLVEQMRFLATEVVQRGSPLFQSLAALDQEIHALFDDILTKRKFSKHTRAKIIAIYEMLQMRGIISPQSFAEEFDEESNDPFEADPQEAHSETSEDSFADDFRDRSQHQNTTSPSAAPDASQTQEFKNLRQTFLRLAATFHPDKVADDSELQQQHTEIMKEINQAYRDGDFARLLEIERQYQVEGVVQRDRASQNDLERQCQRLEQDNAVLKDQYETLKQEVRWLRNTPEGQMVKDYRACVREGIDPFEELLAGAKLEIKSVEKIRDFIKDFRDQKITVEEFLSGPTSAVNMDPEDLAEILSDLLDIPVSKTHFP